MPNTIPTANPVISSTPTANPVIENIIQKYPAALGFVECAEIIGYKSEAAYTSRGRGTFPVRIRQHGQRLVVFTSDLIRYLETGESQAEQSAPLIRKVFKTKSGRPSKRETLEALARHLSVRELRAQSKISGV